MSNYIIIADTSPKRSDETERLALGSVDRGATTVTLFDASRHPDRAILTREIVTRVTDILSQRGKVLVVTNCIMGVRFDLLQALGNIRTPHHDLLKRVLLTCKNPDEIKAGFAQRGLSLEGVEHIVWSAFDPSYHQAQMKSIFVA